MGLFDEFAGVVENAVNAHPGGASGMFNEALSDLGGLDGVVSKLNQAGLGDKVSSWLGDGANAPLTADEVRAALTPQHLEQIAGKLGIPTDAVPSVLAQHLPTAVAQQGSK